MSDRRASGRPGDSYQDDAYYRPIEADLERQYGLPEGALAAIRKQGERTNRGVVSSAGGRSVYQIIPGTRDLFLKKYGVNAYAGDADAARVAALHLKESLDRTGDWSAAVAEYHGGPDKSQHGPINRAYVQRVTGKIVSVPGRGGATALAPGVDLNDFSMEDLQHTAPVDVGSRKPLGPKPKGEKAPTVAQIITGGNIIAPAQADARPDTEQVNQINREAVNETASLAQFGFLDRLEASMDKNFITNMVIRGLSRDTHEGDPEWHKKYLENQDAYEKFAENQDELDLMRSSRAQRSFDDFMDVQREIEEARQRDRIIGSSGHAFTWELGTTVADPVGWIATAGVGKLGQAAFKGPSLARLAIEGATVNIGFEAARDFSGDKAVSVEDYLKSGVIGLGMGAALYPILGRTGADTSVMESITGETARVARQADEIAQEAALRVPEGSSPRVVQEAQQGVVVDRTKREIEYGLGDIADEDKFLSADPELARTANTGVRGRVIQDNNLGTISDPAEQAIYAEAAARADDIVERAGDLSKGLEGRLLKSVGLESDGLTLLRSGSNALKAAAINLLEITTGAGGRKPSAAIQQVMRERAYMRHMVNYDESFEMWRRAEGISKADTFFDTAHRARFDREVMLEVERRAQVAEGSLSRNPAVVKAADAWEEGMNTMRLEQQAVKSLGNERLGDTSRGYFRHMIDPRKLLALSPDQKAAVEGVLAKQFRSLNEYTYIDKATKEKVTKAFDLKFSRRLAKEYIAAAERRGMGAFDVPANLYSSEAADVISDALVAMKGIPAAERDAILGKYSRGGPAYTKGRLKLDLTAEIGDGMLLGDVFRQDILGLYRGYARHVSGEVALANYGVYGKKGLDMLRDLARRQGATADELKAFERVGAEFLNQPWHGATRIQALDNLRLITSASRLGGMGFTQIGEFGNALAAVGVKAVLSNIGSAKRLIREVGKLRKGLEADNPILRDLDSTYGNIGMEGYQLQRVFDSVDNKVELYNDEAAGLFTKAVRAGAHFNSIASGHRAILAVQTRGMAEQILRKAMGYIRSGKEDIALADMGFTKEIKDHLREHMDSIAKFDSRGRLTSLDLYAAPLEPRIVQAMAQAVERGSAQIIQRTFIGETGKWAHDDWLKLLFQFRTFSLTSVEKQWGRNVANYGAVKSFAILMGAMGFALPIHATRVQARMVGMSRKEREDYAEKNLNTNALTRATLNYASSAGLLGDFLDITSTMGTKVGVLPKEYATASGARTGSTGGVGTLVPGIGMMDDLYKGTVGGQFKKLPKVLPGSNLPAVAPVISGLTPDSN